jgi:Protein kinase domain
VPGRIQSDRAAELLGVSRRMVQKGVNGSQRWTRQGTIVGTLAYIAPEQIRGFEGDERSDLYSLACVLYELLSGRKPFVGENEYEVIRAQIETQPEPLTRVVPELDSHIHDAVARALAKEPDQRFASLEEFAAMLGATTLREEAMAITREELRPGDGPRTASPITDVFHPGRITPVPDAPSAIAAEQPMDVALPIPQPSVREKRRLSVRALAAAAVAIVIAGGYLAYDSSGAVALVETQMLQAAAAIPPSQASGSAGPGIGGVKQSDTIQSRVGVAAADEPGITVNSENGNGPEAAPVIPAAIRPEPPDTPLSDKGTRLAVALSPTDRCGRGLSWLVGGLCGTRPRASSAGNRRECAGVMSGLAPGDPFGWLGQRW